jgi:membrane-associated HD superfamily phosphohydrolase
VNIRDERTVGEQVKSGLRLAGWLLLTLAFIYVLLLCAGFVVGKGEYNQPIYRVAGACGLVALSVLMFMTVRHWVGWFIGALCYFVVKTAVALLLGSSIVRPRLWFIEFALLLGLAILLCVRYVSRKPQRIEAVGLVGLVLALSFALVCDSNNPILIGVAALGLIQFAYGRKRRTATSKAG